MRQCAWCGTRCGKRARPNSPEDLKLVPVPADGVDVLRLLCRLCRMFLVPAQPWEPAGLVYRECHNCRISHHRDEMHRVRVGKVVRSVCSRCFEERGPAFAATVERVRARCEARGAEGRA